MSETNRLGRGFFFAVVTILITSISGLSANALTREDVKELVIIEAERHRLVPIPLALAVARVESNFQADAKSHKGARGVMQIMPKTAKDVFGVSENELWGAPQHSPRFKIFNPTLSSIWKTVGPCPLTL